MEQDDTTSQNIKGDGIRNTFSNVHGTQPTHLIEKILRDRIVESLYFKEQCFGHNAATILDLAIELKYIGGQFGNQRPSEFICLVYKLLQLRPEPGIVHVYLNEASDDFKYLRALAAFYIRLTYPSDMVYITLEPLLADYRKLKSRNLDGGFSLTYMDQFVDDLLTQERVLGISLPIIRKRSILEDEDKLAPRQSALNLDDSD